MKLQTFVPPYSDTNKNLPSGESPMPLGLLMPPAATRGRGIVCVCVGHMITWPAAGVGEVNPAGFRNHQIIRLQPPWRSPSLVSIAGSIATIVFFSSRGPPSEPCEAPYNRPSGPNFIPLIFGLPSNHTLAFPSAPTLYSLARPRSLK